ncbi:rod shape-determining protein MreD [Paenibacillus filicis]|uniref:Rod shape-determining protein MreD n=1 Tax=Paenibacillus gyeongsangnamensis TaxID=3388067 RepID=A0ABT4Q8Z6_9BACL|nr:rod shape-determining protein MreD [Paenibacillus filicis]MCZ8513349.1 rod shape-determining protein MreD [Paenibacillus filicis]
MHRRLCLLLTALFLLESTVLPWILPVAWQSKVLVSPHFSLVIVLFIGLFANRHTALLYGLFFGMLNDIIHFSPMLGPVAFSMGLTGYLAGLMNGRLYSSIVVSMLVIALGNLSYEMIIFGLYRLFRVTHLDFQWAFFHQMLPSMLINLLFALAVYVPLRKMFESHAISSSAAEE